MNDNENNEKKSEKRGRGRPVVWTRERLLKHLRARTEELGRPAGIKELCGGEGQPSYMAYRYHFGSINKAREAAGMEIVKPGHSLRYWGE